MSYASLRDPMALDEAEAEVVVAPRSVRTPHLMPSVLSGAQRATVLYLGCMDSLLVYQRPNSSSTSDQDAWQHDMYDQPQESTRQPRRRAAASSDEASNKLKIENLHYEVSEAELDVRVSLNNPLYTVSPRQPVALLSDGRAREAPDHSSTVLSLFRPLLPSRPTTSAYHCRLLTCYHLGTAHVHLDFSHRFLVGARLTFVPREP